MTHFRRCGMSMRTPAGSVDMVPLYRRLAGDKKAPVLEDERPAAILALTHLGVPMDRIHRALNMAHRDVRAVILAHGMVPVKSAQEQFSWTALAWRSKRRRRAAA